MDISRTSAIGFTVSIAHLILLTAALHVFFRSIGFLDLAVRRRTIRAFSVGDVLARPCAVGVPASTERGPGEGKRRSRAAD